LKSKGKEEEEGRMKETERKYKNRISISALQNSIFMILKSNLFYSETEKRSQHK
jgi:hypothetical protein